jgi:hypothetical protein
MTTDFTARLAAIALTVVASATLLIGAVGPAAQPAAVAVSQVA